MNCTARIRRRVCCCRATKTGFPFEPPTDLLPKQTFERTMKRLKDQERVQFMSDDNRQRIQRQLEEFMDLIQRDVVEMKLQSSRDRSLGRHACVYHLAVA